MLHPIPHEPQARPELRWTCLLLLPLFAGCATESVLGSIATKDEVVREGRKLTSQELTQLMRPGTRIIRWEPGGYVQRWKNEPDGSFVANTTSSFAWGHGKWRLHDDTYCIRVDWITKDQGKIAEERGCYAIYTLRGKYFYGPPPANLAESQKLGEIRIN